MPRGVRRSTGRSDLPRTVRQLALIFDWCGPVMTKAQSDQLAGKIGALVDANPGGDAVHQRDRAFGAIALADHLTDHGEKILADIVNQWWRGDIVKKIAAGQPAIPREQVYAFYELMHAIRDNLKIDMREAALTYFHSLPIDHLCGHYPAPFQAPENDFRIPVFVHEGEPDLTQAAMSRAAEMSMVAYDDNALESQFLQGWLMQDRFHDARSAGRGLRIPMGESVSAGAELFSRAAGVSRRVHRARFRAHQLG